jgi:riboflavin kinase/FMN adenylyltransferase
VLPPAGVYAVQVILDGNVHGGIANLGVHPTFGAAQHQLLEVHLFDFDADLYGRELEVCFLARLRGEQRFAGAEALKAQVAADVERAREILRS